jgi:hypothetical protein
LGGYAKLPFLVSHLPICVFETVAGETFSEPRPPMSHEEEADVIALLRDILKDEGQG